MPADFFAAASEIGAGFALVYLIFVIDRQHQRQQETEQKRMDLLAEVIRDLAGRREGASE